MTLSYVSFFRSHPFGSSFVCQSLDEDMVLDTRLSNPWLNTSKVYNQKTL